MEVTGNNEDTSADAIPEVFWDVLINQKTKEVQDAIDHGKKLQSELNEKKHEYEVWKLKLEAREKEERYLKEACNRIEAEEKKLAYELALAEAGLAPKSVQRAREIKTEQEHCNKLRTLWEKFKISWEAKPLAIERRRAKNRFLLAQVHYSLMQNKVLYQRKINKIQTEIDDKRLQAAVISFARTSLDRRALDKELMDLNDTVEDLQNKLMLLRAENEARCSLQLPEGDCYLTPPPPKSFINQKPLSDTTSISTMIWEDIIGCSERQSTSISLEWEGSVVSEQIAPVVTKTYSRLNKEPLEKKNSHLSHNSIQPTKSNVSNHNEMQECSSTVDIDMQNNYDSVSLQMPKQFEQDLDHISMQSDHLTDLCACSSSGQFFDSRTNSFTSLRRNDQVEEMDFSDEETNNNGPTIQSVENITTQYKIIKKDFNTDSAANTSSKPTEQAEDVKRPTKDLVTDDDLSSKIDFDNLSTSDFDIGKFRKRGLSISSDMGTDFDIAGSMMSSVRSFKAYGNISPPSLMRPKMKKSDETKTENKQENVGKMVYSASNIQQGTTFMDQSDSDKTNKVSLF